MTLTFRLKGASGRTLVLLFPLLGACSSAPPPAAEDAPPLFQSVRIDTPGVAGAACVIQTPTGSFVVTTPVSAEVPVSAAPLVVSCSKGEHYRGAQTVAARPMLGETYSYPACVSVPMTLHPPSLKQNYRVFRSE